MLKNVSKMKSFNAAKNKNILRNGNENDELNANVILGTTGKYMTTNGEVYVCLNGYNVAQSVCTSAVISYHERSAQTQ